MAKHEISKTEVQLKLHELFSALTLEQQEMVFENLTIHSYRKNELIYCEGETEESYLNAYKRFKKYSGCEIEPSH